jgi:hypothetical protein
MPLMNGGKQAEGEPRSKPPMQPPIQPPNNGNLPTPPADNHSEENAAKRLKQDMQTGEKWLIFIQSTTLLVSVVIACIYYGQMKEMRIATEETRNAVKVARDTLTETQLNNARQATLSEQNRASAEKAAKDSLQATIENFHQEHRAYLIPVNSIERGGDYGLLKISLRNYGHVSAKNVRLTLTLDHISSTYPTIRESIPISLKAKEIKPGDSPTYVWDVFTPNFGSDAAFFYTGTHTLRVLGTAEYDTGFGGKDTVGICYGFQGIHKEWELCGGDSSIFVTRSK